MRAKSRLSRRLQMILATVFLLSVLLLQACGSQSSTDSASYEGGSGSSSGATSVRSESAQGSQLNIVDVDDQAGERETVLLSASSDPSISRKVIYTAHVDLRVEDYESAERQIREWVNQSGGYMIEFSEEHGDDEAHGHFVFKVPAHGFMPFLERLEQLDVLELNRRINGQDVSEEYVDLSSRLEAKKIVEKRLIAFMEEADDSDALLRFSQELGTVQEEIERIKGRLRYLDQHVDYSTVHIYLFERADKVSAMNNREDAFGSRIIDAFMTSTNGMFVFLRELIIFIAAILPVVVVLSLVIVPIGIVARHIRAKRSQEKEAKARLNQPDPKD